MPVTKTKQGKPLGGIGAERQSPRKHSLVIDDRLLSKQYITGKLDARVSDDAFGSSWADVTSVAPSKNAINDKFNALSITTSAWTQEDAASTSSKTRIYDTGYLGIGAGSGLAYSNITERLTVDGNIKLNSEDDRIYLGDDSYIDANGGSFMFKNYDTTNLEMGLRTANSTDKIRIHFKPAGNDKGAIGHLGNEVLDIWNAYSNITFSNGSDTERMRINSTGLGIGTASPSYRLDVNGTSRFTGAVTMASDLTVAGNLTVTGTATSLSTEAITLDDNTIVLNSNATGTTDANAGIEIERGDYANVGLRFNGTSNAWQVQSATDNSSAGSWSDIATGATAHDAVTIDNQGTGLLSLSTQAITINDVMVKNAGDAMTGNLAITVAGSSASCLSINGGDAAAANAAVSIVGHLEADTKSFNIPHPLDSNKRLIYGCLEGPEYGMYQRGSFDIEDGRRIVAIDLPVYWSAMTFEDYTVNLTTYGDYNVWISNRDENGFWVETNSEKEWSFDWSVIAGRKDATLVVEPNAR